MSYSKARGAMPPGPSFVSCDHRCMYSTYDRFKWTALLDAAYIDNGSAVYADVKRRFPEPQR